LVHGDGRQRLHSDDQRDNLTAVSVNRQFERDADSVQRGQLDGDGQRERRHGSVYGNRHVQRNCWNLLVHGDGRQRLHGDDQRDDHSTTVIVMLDRSACPKPSVRYFRKLAVSDRYWRNAPVRHHLVSRWDWLVYRQPQIESYHLHSRTFRWDCNLYVEDNRRVRLQEHVFN